MVVYSREVVSHTHDRTGALSTLRLSTFDLYFIIDGKAAASTISFHAHQPPPGHDPVRVSYPWAPMC